MDSRQQLTRRLPLPAQHGDFMAVSFVLQSRIAFPAVGVHEAARLDSFFDKGFPARR